MLKIQYLVAVGEGARGTADRLAPVNQTLSVLASGAQLRNTINMRIPPVPYPEEFPSFWKLWQKHWTTKWGTIERKYSSLDKKMDGSWVVAWIEFDQC